MIRIAPGRYVCETTSKRPKRDMPKVMYRDSPIECHMVRTRKRQSVQKYGACFVKRHSVFAKIDLILCESTQFSMLYPGHLFMHNNVQADPHQNRISQLLSI